MRQNTPQGARGFSLAEMLVVVTIVSILALVVLGSMGSAAGDARDAQRLRDIKTIQETLELFFAEHGRYPGTEEGLATCHPDALIRPGTPIYNFLDEYLAEVPMDPLHDDVHFFYAYDAEHRYQPDPHDPDSLLRNDDFVDMGASKTFGVNRFEGGPSVSPGKGTYSGDCANLDDAHFNIAYCDYETGCEETSFGPVIE